MSVSSRTRSALCIAFACRLAAAGEGGIGSFFVHGYATLNYQAYDWQTDPRRRATMDLERLAIEPAYQAADWLRFKAEIEFEHGGTGAEMEFDKFEEFGEFEPEIDKGGEVQVEELCAEASFHPAFNLRLGHLFVPLGYAYRLDEPTDYFTVLRSEAESNLIPTLWHETGAEIFGSAGPLDYSVLAVNGLDAAGFSSATWIARGRQGRFEYVNAGNLALAGRLDFHAGRGAMVGLAGYYGNSADNRPKPDLAVPAHVGIAQAHGDWAAGPLRLRGLFLYGWLENSGAVSAANRNLSNNLNVKRTPVGAAAFGWFAEAGIEVLEFLRGGWRRPGSGAQRLDLFGRIDRYDTMRRMAPDYFNNPRWDRTAWTGGLAYAPHPRWVLKGQGSYRLLGLAAGNEEITYALGTGFVF
jgi:hypothetical protein